MIAVLALVAALACTAFGQLAYKQLVDGRRGGLRSGWRDPRSLRLLFMALALFGTAQIGFFLALRGLSVGVVYMSTGLTQVLVLALSRVVLREGVGSDHAIAVGLILSGLALYAA